MKIYKALGIFVIAGVLLWSPITATTGRPDMDLNPGADSSGTGSGTASAMKAISVRLKGFPSRFVMTDALQGWGIQSGGVWVTEDGGRSWRHPFSNTVPVPEETRYTDAGFFFRDAATGWIVTASGAFKPIEIFHTYDEGQSWKKTSLPVAEDWEQGYSGSFIHFYDENNGYILLHSEPGLGLMEKSLYRTTDGGSSWKRVGNLSGSIKSYPTGVTFRDALNGWITSSYHGQEFILTFRTTDGGKNWKSETLKNPPALEAFTYSNSYPPVFSGKNNLEGLLPLEIVDDGIRSMVFYTSHNGGDSWTFGPQLQGVEAARTAWLNAREGWALQEGGNLLATTNGGASFRVAAKSTLFDKAESVQFSTSKNGWIAGPGFLLSSVDGGKTWGNAGSK